MLVFQQRCAGYEVLSLLTQQTTICAKSYFMLVSRLCSWDILFMSPQILGISQTAIKKSEAAFKMRVDPPASWKSASCVILFFSRRRQFVALVSIALPKKKKKNLNPGFYRLFFEAKLGYELGNESSLYTRAGIDLQVSNLGHWALCFPWVHLCIVGKHKWLS